MGQRFQSVFILPKIYMNENNPNNRNKRVFVYHNQWLYGFMALKVNLNIMKRLKQAITKRALMGSFANTKKDFTNHFLEKSLRNAINWAGLQDLHNERDFSLSNEFKFKDFEDLGLNLSKEDNNNGFFICEIDEKLKIKYAFISGFEDEDIIKIKNPKEYLSLFYNDKQIKDFPKKDKKILKDYLKFEGMNLYNLSKTKETLNKNKPTWAKGYEAVLKHYS